MRNVKVTRELKKYGFDLGHGRERLTNLRFADDLLMTGRSRKQVAKMLEDLSNASRHIGLDVHMGRDEDIIQWLWMQGRPNSRRREGKRE